MNLDLKKILVFIALISVVLINYPSVDAAVGSLENPKDTINNMGVGAYARHTIRFTLPTDAESIKTTDFIIIDLPAFTNINEPTFISGNYLGTPVFTLLGTRIRITGISVLPGTLLTINGISANNPYEESYFDLYIRITSDADGFHVRNQAHIMATKTDGSVTLTADLEAKVGALKISGFASPGMFVTFTEGGTVLGTTGADASGKFSQIFPGMSPEIHIILVFGSDVLNRLTPSRVITVLTPAYETVEVAGIILPPTISLDKDQISHGESITVTGRGMPNYKLTVFTQPPQQSYETTINPEGDYSYTITDTNDLELGDHQVNALMEDGAGMSSMFSFNLFFKVIDSTPPPGEGCGDISKGDLNCDSQVNLTDFSILLYYWGTDSSQADINNDSNVNLIDFSIMMFYWQE